MAKLYQSQGDLDRALPLHERAVANWEKALPGHPNLAKGLKNYATILEKMGRQDEAKKLKARAQRIRDEHARKNPKSED